jgi:hypothetical protein
MPVLLYGIYWLFSLSERWGEDQGVNAVFDKLKTTGTGATFGAGVEIPSAIVTSLLAEFRYSPSFDNAYVKTTRSRFLSAFACSTTLQPNQLSTDEIIRTRH